MGVTNKETSQHDPKATYGFTSSGSTMSTKHGPACCHALMESGDVSLKGDKSICLPECCEVWRVKEGCRVMWTTCMALSRPALSFPAHIFLKDPLFSSSSTCLELECPFQTGFVLRQKRAHFSLGMTSSLAIRRLPVLLLKYELGI